MATTSSMAEYRRKSGSILLCTAITIFRAGSGARLGLDLVPSPSDGALPREAAKQRRLLIWRATA